MNSIKTMLTGLLMCLICLYLMNEEMGSIFLVIGGYGFPFGVIVTIVGLFIPD